MNLPRLSQIGLIYLRIGNLTFGGGDPTIAALQRELVDRKGWLSPDNFALAFSLARVTPGTNLLAFCAGAAWFLAGWPGAILGVVAATVPSAVLAVWLTRVFDSSSSNPLASAAIAGTLAAAVGMMIAVAWLLARTRFKPGKRIRSVILVVTPAVLLLFFHVPPVAALAATAVVGLVWK